MGPGRIDLFTRGAGDAMHHRSYAVSGWAPWWQVGGVLNGPPAIVSHWPGVLDVVVTGGDNTGYHQTFFGGWWGWQRLGGVASSGPSVASWQSGRTDIFVRGSAGSALEVPAISFFRTSSASPTGQRRTSGSTAFRCVATDHRSRATKSSVSSAATAESVRIRTTRSAPGTSEPSERR